MPSGKALSAIVFALVWICTGRGQSGDVVQMPSVRVVADLFQFRYTFRDDHITEVVVTDVTPKSEAAKGGLKSGDRLAAINGVPVVGMGRAQFEALMDQQVGPDHPKTLSFTCTRGWLVKRHFTVQLTFAFRQKAGSPQQ